MNEIEITDEMLRAIARDPRLAYRMERMLAEGQPRPYLLVETQYDSRDERAYLYHHPITLAEAEKQGFDVAHVLELGVGGLIEHHESEKLIVRLF
jgi:hypothetical protein